MESSTLATSGCLADEIALLAAQVDVGMHRLLTCIRRFDESEEWAHQGARTCADWLAWRIGLVPGAAREKVRVARALGKFAAIVGPAMMGLVSLMTGDSRLSILSLAVLLLAGGGLLVFVREPERQDGAPIGCN